MTQTIRTIRIATQGPAGPAGLYPHASWSAGSVPYARASVLAHNGGVWLALRDTSAEPSISMPDDWASWLDFGGMITGFATLGPDGKIQTAQLPAIAITDTFAVASQAAMLALAAQKGDIAIRSDLSKSFVLAADDPSVLVNWKELLTPTDAVLSVAGRTGAVTLAQGDISGLAASATTDTTNAGNIVSGTLNNARLSGVALTANNLSDLGNAATAATNLGLGSGSDAAHKSLTLTGGTITANAPSVGLSRTWNNAGVNFTLLQADVTSMAAGFGSLLFDYRVGGASQGRLTPAGFFIAAGGYSVSGNPATAGWTGLLGDANSMGLVITNNGNSRALNYSRATATPGLAVLSNFGYLWSSSVSDAAATADLALMRDAANVLAQRVGTSAQAFRIYNTYTDASNYERAHLRWNANVFEIGTGAAGTGSTRSTSLTDAAIAMPNLPTSDPHVAGRLWSNSGLVAVSAG